MAKVNKIQYDVSDITSAKNSLTKLIDSLNTSNNELDSALAQLKKDWNTETGKKFFDEHKNTWTTYVELYVKKLTGIRDMLSKAESEYNKITDEVSNLRI